MRDPVIAVIAMITPLAHTFPPGIQCLLQSRDKALDGSCERAYSRAIVSQRDAC